MTPISHRHLLAVLALMALPLALVVRNVYGERRNETCRDAAGLYEAWDLGAVLEARERWDLHRGPWIQWTEGTIAPHRRDAPALDFRIIRSFEPRRIYLRPGSFLPGRLEPERQEPHVLTVGGQPVPVTVGLLGDHERNLMRVAAWMFVYEDRPVASPLRAQLASAFPQIVRGTHPLTLYIVSGLSMPDDPRSVEEHALRWLARAWEHHADVCGG